MPPLSFPASYMPFYPVLVSHIAPSILSLTVSRALYPVLVVICALHYVHGSHLRLLTFPWQSCPSIRPWQSLAPAILSLSIKSPYILSLAVTCAFYPVSDSHTPSLSCPWQSHSSSILSLAASILSLAVTYPSILSPAWLM